MAATTKIQWTDATFNPWRGCTKVSPGCTNCYADTQSKRNPGVLGVWGPKGTRVLASESKWREPAHWNEEANLCLREPEFDMRVFCASLADVFEDWRDQMVDSQGRKLWYGERYNGEARPVTADTDRPRDMAPYTLAQARGRLFDLIRRTPRLTWQLLTKRPENLPAMMPRGDWPNVWLGTSVETMEYAWRVDALTEARERINCPVGFISYEPALGPLDLGRAICSVQWVIVGGESGGNARQFDVTWAKSVINQCREAGVACFVKQIGATPVRSGNRPDGMGRFSLPLTTIHDRKGGDMAEWPSDLRVREFPSPA